MPKDSNDKPNHPGIDLDTVASPPKNPCYFHHPWYPFRPNCFFSDQVIHGIHLNQNSFFSEIEIKTKDTNDKAENIMKKTDPS